MLAFEAYRTVGCIINGTHASGLRMATMCPKNPGRATPAIVKLAPLMTSSVPTADAAR